MEPDGLGGFASGTATGVRTRRYHAILLAATQPPAGRMVLVNGLDVWVETPAGRFPLSEPPSYKEPGSTLCEQGMEGRRVSAEGHCG